MVESSPQNIGKLSATRWLVMEFILLCVLFGALLTVAASYLLSIPVWSLTFFAAGAGVVARGLWIDYPHESLGLCNVVTLARATATALLFGAVFEAGTVSQWAVFWIAIGALALDGVDGYLARRSGLQSEFGARFDMETDAALGAILSVWLLVSGIAGPAVLVLGFLRYLFIFAGWIYPALKGPLPGSLRRKTICVVQISALIALALPVLPGGLVTPILLISAGLLVYSFLADTAWLLRRGT